MCRMIQDLPTYEQDSTISWDEKAIMACVCDGGYLGADCSLRICPFGDDPVTTCDLSDNVEQVQQVRVFVELKMDTDSSDPGDPGLQDLGAVIGDEVSLSFLTQQGHNYTTHRIEGIWGDHDDATSTSMSYDDLVTNYGSNGADTEAANRIEVALEDLPNFAIKDVTVSHDSVAATSDYIESVWKVTFHHLQSGQSNYGAQNLLHCHLPNVCAGPGCQPRVRQSYWLSIYETDAVSGSPSALSLVNPENLLSTLAFAAAGGTDTWVRFHRDSVLSCPPGETCTSSSLLKTIGSVWVVYKSSSTSSIDGDIFVKVLGSDNAESPELTDLSGVTVPEATDSFLDSEGYTYMGKVTSSNKGRFDITSLLPNTFLEIDGLTADTSAGAILFYDPANCDVRDVTEDDTRDSEVAFANVDVENIECAGRGECDRTSGECRCFEGYTGLACETQTTMV